MDKYIYHSGNRTLGASATVSVSKSPGDDQFKVSLDVSSTASAMDALEAIVRCYSEWMCVPVAHILCVMATVITGCPSGQIERDGVGNEL